MDPDAAHQTWEDYYARMSRRRMSEAKAILAQMRLAHVNAGTPIHLDFGLFSPNESTVRTVAAQLQENYAVTVRRDVASNYWFAEGTTRPNVHEVSDGEFLAWVDFMLDVAHSTGAVFTAFRVEDPQSGRAWSNQDVESGDD